METLNLTQKERLDHMEKCGSFDRCSASVCGLDRSGEGSYVSGDKFCPLILDYLEGKEFPRKEAIKANEHLWRKHLSDKLIATRLTARNKLRGYWADRKAQKTNKTTSCKGVTGVGNDKPLTGSFISDSAV